MGSCLRQEARALLQTATSTEIGGRVFVPNMEAARQFIVRAYMTARWMASSSTSREPLRLKSVRSFKINIREFTSEKIRRFQLAGPGALEMIVAVSSFTIEVSAKLKRANSMRISVAG